MTNPIIEKCEQWLWKIAVKKGIYSAVKVIVAFVTSVKVTPILEGAGIKIDPVALAGALTTGLTAGLTILHNWLKVKFCIKWL